MAVGAGAAGRLLGGVLPHGVTAATLPNESQTLRCCNGCDAIEACGNRPAGTGKRVGDRHLRPTLPPALVGRFHEGDHGDRLFRSDRGLARAEELDDLHDQRPITTELARLPLAPFPPSRCRQRAPCRSRRPGSGRCGRSTTGPPLHRLRPPHGLALGTVHSEQGLDAVPHRVHNLDAEIANLLRELPTAVPRRSNRTPRNSI